MTGRGALTIVSLARAAVPSGCSELYQEIPIETPIQPKLDVRPFSRVYVAGFVAAGTRGRRWQPGNRAAAAQPAPEQGPLRVIDADALDLADVAGDRARPGRQRRRRRAAAAAGRRRRRSTTRPSSPPYEKVFADTEYWKKIGQEFQQPLIVTGTVLFRPHQRSGFVQRERETFDSLGRRRVEPERTYMERKGFILRPSFIFIDGRTGETLHTETFREEILYNANQKHPGAVVVLRADGPAAAELPEHPQRPARSAAAGCCSSRQRG